MWLLWLCQGCFVFDELDKGKALMEQHSPRASTDKAESGRTRAGRETEGEEGFFVLVSGRARNWWAEFNEPAAPKRDPDDVVVRCEVRGGLQFMRKSDCELRSGRAHASGG